MRDGWQVLFVSLWSFPLSCCQVCGWFHLGHEHRDQPSDMREVSWGEGDLSVRKPWVLPFQLCTTYFLTFICRKQTSPLLLLLSAFICTWTDRLTYFKSFVFDSKKPVKWVLWSSFLQSRKLRQKQVNHLTWVTQPEIAEMGCEPRLSNLWPYHACRVWPLDQDLWPWENLKT